MHTKLVEVATSATRYAASTTSNPPGLFARLLSFASEAEEGCQNSDYHAPVTVLRCLTLLALRLAERVPIEALINSFFYLTSKIENWASTQDIRSY